VQPSRMAARGVPKSRGSLPRKRRSSWKFKVALLGLISTLRADNLLDFF
jgi:hypothetical protein